ncbi:MAG: hypothetical protein RI575_17805 [Balneolaceae bacterium]|nr:hypothetical protein [Balneolaceae bacterium]
MEKLYPVFLFAVTAVLILFTACTSKERKSIEKEQNQVQPETVFENDLARVVMVSLQPGQKLASHDGAERLIYSLTDYTIEWIVNGESEGEKTWSTGDVHVHEADTHTAVNNGSERADWLALVRKTDEMPGTDMQSLEKDVNSLEDDFAEMIFDNESFRVTEVRLAPGESIPSHEGIHRIIYSMSDYMLEYEADNTGLIERSFEAGEAHWHVPGTHMMRNIGDTEAYFLVVSYK